MATDDLFLLHLVDSADWVADHERNLCVVCTRSFGTFRRKHHCRMCGEVVCNNCTLYKDAMIESTRVRVCMSCVMNNSTPWPGRPHGAVSRQTSEVSRLWLQSHLHSPVSRPSSEPDCDELQLCSSTPKSGQHYNLFSVEDESRNTCKKNLQVEQQSNEASFHWTHPWPQPPVNADEEDRLQVLHSLHVLDTQLEKPFDMICDLAKARLSCPMAAVSFLDKHRQWFKASAGLARKMIPRKIAFCAYTVHTREPMVVLDTLQDPRFRNNPLVLGAAGVRFYAAAPILGPNSDHAVGSVFVLDTRPREACDISILERLALAAGENLAGEVASVVDYQLQFDDNNAEESKRHQDNGRDVTVENAAQKEGHSFDKAKIGVPMSPATSTSALSMSSVAFATSAAQAPLPATPLDNNDGDGSQDEDTSVAMTQLSMESPAAGEQMEVLLMRLLTQNTVTQHRLAVQQTSLSTKLGQHTDQISKLMSDFARMEAKVESKVDGRTK
ncbi:hypothetical protein KXD40_003781 [Peronospora effusa]|uniref:FYVE-type domain-containing protein n=1 Tax=Peronospora effusa TaxID=542832 RepID=A0A3M6V940_9STRA|nr:hypothetical protein DD238_008090 [Peronospora effusa]UIZ22876.1 hypothetical protein KXD40_003781 [Peronospora effusa]CAI5703285.1 unnamed protein product [Peronospora effusa]